MIENKTVAVLKWLGEYLRAHDGTAYVSDVYRDALANGHTISMLRLAKEALPIVAHRQGFGQGGRFYWELKENPISEGTP